jgi:transposase
METRRGEWAERVAGWRRSGLTAKQYASSIGVNAGTLTHWAWRLGQKRRRRRARPRERGGGSTAPATLIEVISNASANDDDRFEVRLENGRRLHVPARFEAAALERLLGVLEAKR